MNMTLHFLLILDSTAHLYGELNSLCYTLKPTPSSDVVHWCNPLLSLLRNMCAVVVGKFWSEFHQACRNILVEKFTNGWAKLILFPEHYIWVYSSQYRQNWAQTRQDPAGSGNHPSSASRLHVLSQGLTWLWLGQTPLVSTPWDRHRYAESHREAVYMRNHDSSGKLVHK